MIYSLFGQILTAQLTYGSCVSLTWWEGGLTRVPLVPEVPVEIGAVAVPSLVHAVLPPQSVLLIDMIKCVLPAQARLKYARNINI